MNESAYKGIVLAFGLLLLGVVALWLYSRYSEIRTAAIERKKAETAAYIKSRVSAMVDPAVFDGGDFIRQRQVFQSFFDTIRSRQLAGIKIWDRDMTVLWSNLGELTGQRFPENYEVRKALDGEIEFGVRGQYTEHLTERQFHELSYAYVPISDANGNIVGVVEVYQPTLSLHEEIGSEFQQAALPVGAFMFIGYGMLVVLLHMLMAPKNLGVGENPIRT
jgi:hypothetical protein